MNLSYHYTEHIFSIFFTQGRVTTVYVMNNSSDFISQHESLFLLLNDAFLTEKASKYSLI